MHQLVKKGTTSKLFLIFAREQDSNGARGLQAETTDAKAAYIREGADSPVAFRLRPGRVGAYAEGGFAEVDADLLPGIYQLGVPDGALADGADSVVVMLQFAKATIDPIHVTLVAYDPQDGNRMGMTAIGPEERVAALRSAFPLLAARELREAVVQEEAPNP